MDCALLYRSTRFMFVSAAGQRVYKASAVTEAGLSELTERDEQVAGRLAVAASSRSSCSWLLIVA